MSLIQSSTTTITSPYASMTASRGPRPTDPGVPEQGSVMGALSTVASAIEEGASATVSLSAQALNALETGAKDVGTALYDVTRAAVGGAVNGVEEVAEGAWNGVKTGVADVASAVGQGATMIEHGIEDVGAGIVAGWHDVANGAGRAATLASEMTSSVVAGGKKALDVAGDVGSAVGDGAMTVLDGAGNVASSIASYATLGVAAGQKLFTAIV